MSVQSHVPSHPRRLELPVPFDVEVRPARERVVVAPRGELDIATAERVESEIDGLVAAGFADIVLDLRGLTFMDSTGVWLVLRQVRRPDVAVHLIDGSGPVARLFDVTGVREDLPFLEPDEVLRLR
jgi:anti-anti-sigma factor